MIFLAIIPLIWMRSRIRSSESVPRRTNRGDILSRIPSRIVLATSVRCSAVVFASGIPLGHFRVVRLTLGVQNLPKLTFVKNNHEKIITFLLHSVVFLPRVVFFHAQVFLVLNFLLMISLLFLPELLFYPK